MVEKTWWGEPTSPVRQAVLDAPTLQKRKLRPEWRPEAKTSPAGLPFAPLARSSCCGSLETEEWVGSEVAQVGRTEGRSLLAVWRRRKSRPRGEK